MKLSIIIPTRGNHKNISTSISRLRMQTFQDFECIFVVDQTTAEPFMKNTTHFQFLVGYATPNNASALRNIGMHHAKGEFLLFMDDDEWGDPTYLEQNFIQWKTIREEIQQDFVLCPTLMRRKTQQIQSQGFSHYHRSLSRPTPCHLGSRPWAKIRMYSGNSLFGPSTILKRVQRDERFDFVYEDIEYTYHLSTHTPLIVSRDLHLHHMERDKTILEQAWIGNIYQAYRKAKHRCLFVRTHGKPYEKLKFWAFGFLGQPIRLGIKALMFGRNARRKILGAIARGTRDGI